MGLVSSGIDWVRAFALAGGVRADGGAVNDPLGALVKWRSEHWDKFHQIYVNGELAGVTSDCQQRRMVVPIPTESGSAVRLEVFAVEASGVHIDFGSELQLQQQAGRVKLSWIRSMNLPFEGTAQVFSDGGSGEIDYENPASREAIVLWPSWQDKVGFGLSEYGEGDFGYDGSAAVGFGRGAFGEGEFGFDADEISWESGELETGKHRFAVRIMDRFAQESDAQETGDITLIRTARPAEGLDVSSYDKEEDKLVLCIS